MQQSFYKKHRDILFCLILSIAILTVYFHVRHHEFVGIDDPMYVHQNSYVKDGFTLKGLIWAFFTFTDRAYWHPLTWLSHMLDCEIFGLNSGWHHLVNVFFHIGNSVLLFIVFRMMTGAFWRSGFVALVFALHPINVDSVAWLAERKNLLSTFFWILTMIMYVYYVRRGGMSWYLGMLAVFLLGLLAKPMLVTLPFVLLLLDYWPLYRMRFEFGGGAGKGGGSGSTLFVYEGVPLQKLILEKVPLLVLSLMTIYISSLSLQRMGNIVPTDTVPMNLRIANGVVSYVVYLWKMAWPKGLTFFYPYPIEVPSWQVLGSMVFLGVVTFLVIWELRRRPYLALGWFWYMGTLVPALGLMQGGLWPAIAERWAYVPLIGAYVLIVWGVSDLILRWRHGMEVLVGLGGVVILVLTAITWVQIGYWKNDMTLSEYAIKVNPNNYIAHYNIGRVRGAQQKIDEAIYHYTESLRVNPKFREALNGLGYTLMVVGKYDESMKYYQKSLDLYPTDATVYNNIGIIMAEQGKIPEAIHYLSEAVRLDPNFVPAHNNLSKVLYQCPTP